MIRFKCLETCSFQLPHWAVSLPTNRQTVWRTIHLTRLGVIDVSTGDRFQAGDQLLNMLTPEN